MFLQKLRNITLMEKYAGFQDQNFFTEGNVAIRKRWYINARQLSLRKIPESNKAVSYSTTAFEWD